MDTQSMMAVTRVVSLDTRMNEEAALTPLHERQKREEEHHDDTEAARRKDDAVPLEDGRQLVKDGRVGRFFDRRRPLHVVTDRVRQESEQDVEGKAHEEERCTRSG